MKYKLLLTLLLGILIPPTANSQQSTAVTRAVIIGISDYQSEDIPDLRFADKDAEAFAKYLKSPAGGSMTDENMKVLINQDATYAAFMSQLDWLVEESKEGDKAIIYFSGHGDVESKVARQPGFLLCYDSPPKIYMAGSCPLFYLQLIIETLSSDKNVQTLVITDACRAGKLAGSEIGGTQATAANLAKQYANEIKILSCQPDEFSLEGEQWGGGRGAFSYHLIEGLVGMADKNEDYQVNLLELENYLETVVPEETAPQSQIPMTIGSKGTKVAFVDEDVLTELKSLKERQLPTLTAIESKGFEETLLAGVDSLLQKKYEDFVAALDNDNLMDAQNGKASADELYRELIQEESLKDLHRLMTRQLATALQDDAQQAINAYLLANPTELEKRWKGDTEYTQYPRYLGRAAELLGESHYMYKFLNAKQLYFEGLSLRLEANQFSNSDSVYNIAIQKLEKALSLEDRAAFFYNELGVLNTRLKNSEKAIENFEQAIVFAPEWGLPYANYSLELFYSGQVDSAIIYGEKALEFLPQYPQMYNFLAWIYANDYDWFTKQHWERQGTELSGNLYLRESSTSSLSQNLNRFKRGIELLEIAKEMDSNHYATFLNLGAAYWQIKEYQKAEDELKKAIQIDSTGYLPWFYLGRVYLAQRRTDEGIAAMLKQIEVADNDTQRAVGYNTLSSGYRQKGDMQAQIDALKKAIQLAPGFKYAQSNLTRRYMKIGKYEEAESTLLDILKADRWHLSTYQYLGEDYEFFNRDEDAEYIYLKGLEIKADYMKVLDKLQALYFRREQYDKALEIQERIIKIEPENVLQIITIESLYALTGDAKQAAAYSKKIDRLVNEKWRDLVSIAYQYLYLKNFERADYFLKKARAIKSGDPVNDWNRSCYYSIKGEPKKAIESFSVALEKGYKDFDHIHTDKDATNMRAEPEFPVLMAKYFPGQVFEGQTVVSKNSEPVYYFENALLLAKYYEDQGEQERANFLYEKALSLKPDTLSAKVQMDLVEICLGLNKYQQALENCPDSIHSDDAFTNFDYAKLYYKLNRPEKAEAHFQRFTQLRDNDYRFQRVAVFYYLNSEQALMEKYVAKTEALYPDNPGPYIGRGLMHASLGKYEAAMQALEKGIEKLPDENNLKLVKAFTTATYKPSEKSKAFKALESIYPDASKIETCINLMSANKFERARMARAELSEVYASTIIPALLDKLYVQMLVAQKDFSTAMDIIETNNFVLFPYHVLVNDPALAPLRETERFKTYLWKNYPGKVNP